MQNEVELTATVAKEAPQPVVSATPSEVPPVVEKKAEEPQVVSVVEKKAEEPQAVSVVEKKPEEAQAAPTPTNDWSNVDSFADANASFLSSIINITNTVIGAGILSIAFSIKNAGVFGSILLILVILIPSLMTSYYLSVATVYSKEAVYGDIGTKLCNKAVGICTNITQILLDFGIDVAYMMVLFNQIIDIAREVFKIELIDYKILVSIIVSFVVLFPLTSIKNMEALTFTSGIAVVCVVIFILACIAMGIKGFNARGWDLYAWPQKATDLSGAFAVFVLCFCSHVNTSKITAEIHYPKNSKFASKAGKATKATVVAYSFCAFAYLVVGILGYLAFGNGIQGSILDSMGSMDVWYRPVVRVGYGCVVMFSYPILAYPACCTLDSWMFKGERTATRRYTEAFIWVLITMLVAIFIPSLSDIFGVSGNFCGVLLTFVWPALYFIALCRKEKNKPKDQQASWLKVERWQEIVAWVILVVGIIVCIYATGLEIMNLVNKWSAKPTVAPTLAPSVAPTTALPSA